MSLFSQLLSKRPDLASEVPTIVGTLTPKPKTGYAQVVKIGDKVLDANGAEAEAYYLWDEPEVFQETVAELAA